MIIAIEIILGIGILAEIIYRLSYVKRQINDCKILTEQSAKTLLYNQLEIDKIAKEVGQLQIVYEQLQKEKDQYNELVKQSQSDIIAIQEKKEELTRVNNQYKDNLNYANEQYLAVLEKNLKDAETLHDKQIIELQNQEQKIKDQIIKTQEQFNKIQNILTAAAAAYRRQEEKENAAEYYTLRIPQEDIDEILKLQELSRKFREPIVLNKLIWKTYVQKRAGELIQRVLNSSAKVCGVYKITNLETQQVYIGQSVNVGDRLLTHIKCGLGIDAPSTKLYEAMYKYGVWNFSFELMEQCESKDLNEVERTLIELYKSAELGYNSTKGNK